MLFHSPREFARPRQAARWLFLGIVAALVVSTLPLTAQAVSQAEVVLNSNGGYTDSDGLRIHYGNGQLQVARLSANQMYSPSETPGSAPNPSILNAIALNVEGVAYTPGVIPSITGSAFANTTQSGGSTGSGTMTGNLDTGVAGFEVDVNITYTSPNNYFNVTLVVHRAATTQPLKLYHFLDSYLAGADAGPGFFTASPAMVGVARPGAVEAFRYVSGPAWTGYFSAGYNAQWPQVTAGQNFDNTIDADPDTDNGFGIMWDLGTAAGTHTVSYDMVFTDTTETTLASAFTDDDVDELEVTELIYTISNDPTLAAKSGLNLVVNLPPGVLVDGIPTTDCVGGVAAIQLPWSVSMYGGSLAQGDPSCSLTIPLSAPAGAYVTVVNDTSTSVGMINSTSPLLFTVHGAGPGTMMAPAVVAGDEQVMVTVTPPSANGSPITGYLVTSEPGGATCAIVAPAVACVVLGLTNGTPYTFTATATNGIGTSPASHISLFATPVAPPARMSAPTAASGDGSATITVVEPVDNGSAITSYLVTASPGGATCAIVAPALVCAITGLSNGTAYTFTATATNANGVSIPSPASNLVTPPGLPATMVAPTATPNNGAATVAVTAPDSNGSAITSYLVTTSPGGVTCAIVAPAVSCVIAGLTNGIAYTFTARATNGNGAALSPSPASAAVTPYESSSTAPPVVAPAGTTVVFTDIADPEVAAAASWLALRGITFGCAAGDNPQFCPTSLATRAEVAALLSRALGLLPTDVDAFTDDNGHMLEGNINAAAAAGVFLGCSNDRLVCPDDAITRGELAAVLVRALDLVSTNPVSFADADGHWSNTFIEVIGGLGISIGCAPDGQTFCPDNFGTRGEIAVFLYRALFSAEAGGQRIN